MQPFRFAPSPDPRRIRLSSMESCLLSPCCGPGDFQCWNLRQWADPSGMVRGACLAASHALHAQSCSCGPAISGAATSERTRAFRSSRRAHPTFRRMAQARRTIVARLIWHSTSRAI
jgi:hypothetical protein